MSVKWIILDMMGVIFEACDDVGESLIPYIQERFSTISAGKIRRMYLKASLGEISSFDFWNEMNLGDEYPEVEKNYLDDRLRIDPDFKKIAESLTENYSLGVLSNEVGDWNSFLRDKFDLNKLFQVVVISSEVGYRKPDKEIYKILLNRIQSPPSECVFVDDGNENLRSASEIGIKTVGFVREKSNIDFSPDSEISNFVELPRAIEELA